MGRVILDSSVLIAFFDDHDAHNLAVHRRFEASEDQYEISALTITEVLTAPLARAESNREIFLQAVTGGIQVIHAVTKEVAILAGSVRVVTGVKTPDAIISATATLAGATLWTLDRKLAQAHKGAVLVS